MSGWAIGSALVEHDLALAVWLHRVGEHEDAFRVGGQSWRRRRRSTGPGRRAGSAARCRGCSRKTKTAICASCVWWSPRPVENQAARVVQRRRDEAVAGGRPLGDPSFGLLLERLELRRERRVVGRVRRQRSVRARGARRAPSRCRSRSSTRRPPAPGNSRPTCRWSFRCLPTWGASSMTRDADGFELRARSDARQHQQVRRPDRAPAQDHLPVGPGDPASRRRRCGTRRRSRSACRRHRRAGHA